MATDFEKLFDANSATDASSYTFASQPLGSNSGYVKFVRVAVRCNIGTSAIPARCRIGGVDLTRIDYNEANNPSDNPKVCVALFAGVVPLTGSQSVVVDITTNGVSGGPAATVLRCGMECGEANNINLTPHAVAKASSGDRTTSSTINIPADGLLLGVAAIGVGVSAVPGTNTGFATVTTGVMIESNNFAFKCMHSEAMTVETARTIGNVFAGGGSDDDHALLAVSFAPNAAGSPRFHAQLIG